MLTARLAVLAVAAAVALTATGVRVGDHHAFVRVVVDFNGKVPASQVWFDKLTGTTATLHIAHPGIQTQTTSSSGDGVRVALQPGTQALHVAMSFAKHRFKYVSYAVVAGNHLAIDLWKSAPPPNGPETGIGGCLSLNLEAGTNGTGSVDVGGMEHGVFEHTFQVIIRGVNGRVLGRRTVIHRGSWNTTLHYHATHRQPGTIEAVSFSQKDGSLACLAQTRWPLSAT